MSTLMYESDEDQEVEKAMEVATSELYLRPHSFCVTSSIADNGNNCVKESILESSVKTRVEEMCSEKVGYEVDHAVGHAVGDKVDHTVGDAVGDAVGNKVDHVAKDVIFDWKAVKKWTSEEPTLRNFLPVTQQTNPLVLNTPGAESMQTTYGIQNTKSCTLSTTTTNAQFTANSQPIVKTQTPTNIQPIENTQTSSALHLNYLNYPLTTSTSMSTSLSTSLVTSPPTSLATSLATSPATSPPTSPATSLRWIPGEPFQNKFAKLIPFQGLSLESKASRRHTKESDPIKDKKELKNKRKEDTKKTSTLFLNQNETEPKQEIKEKSMVKFSAKKELESPRHNIERSRVKPSEISPKCYNVWKRFSSLSGDIFVLEQKLNINYKTAMQSVEQQANHLKGTEKSIYIQDLKKDIERKRDLVLKNIESANESLLIANMNVTSILLLEPYDHTNSNCKKCDKCFDIFGSIFFVIMISYCCVITFHPSIMSFLKYYFWVTE